MINPDPDSELFWETWKIQHPQHETALKAAREIIQNFKFQEQKLAKEDEKEILEHIIKGQYSESKTSPARRFYNFNLRSLVIAASVAIISCFPIHIGL
ncbi:MAG: hypothetical protein HC817_15650 [Saprospiraceae bacterium]|nr:hypothetical protein [Saprospiraceae bacterium]